MWKFLVLVVPVLLASLTALVTENLFNWPASFQELFFYSLLLWAFWGALTPLIMKLQRTFPWTTANLLKAYFVNMAFCAVASFVFIYWELTVWYLAVDGVSIGELIAYVSIRGMLISFAIGLIIYLSVAGVANANIYWHKWKTGRSLINSLKNKLSDLANTQYSLDKSEITNGKFLDRLMVKSNGRAFLIDVDDIPHTTALLGSLSQHAVKRSTSYSPSLKENAWQYRQRLSYRDYVKSERMRLLAYFSADVTIVRYTFPRK